MRRFLATTAVPVVLCAGGVTQAADRVTVDNFKRVETDLYFEKFAADGAFGAFIHERQLVSVDAQSVIRMNRDTLYSYGLADLAAGPATVSLPASDGRFMSLQEINGDHYTPMVLYDAGEHRFDQAQIGSRYVLFLVRTFVDPDSEEDLAVVHALQDRLQVTQGAGAAFEVPDWNKAQAQRIRAALNELAAANGGIDSARMFGPKDQVDPVQHLIGTAAGWGGNPRQDASYMGVTPERNDGQTIYRLSIGEVPVDGFWSISVYNSDGFFEKNDLGRYSINNVTAETSDDGSVQIRFGGCDAEVTNCLPITDGWNYLVRMYRPRAEILDGSWSFPEAEVLE